jgi:hypothetical protein
VAFNVKVKGDGKNSEQEEELTEENEFSEKLGRGL